MEGLCGIGETRSILNENWIDKMNFKIIENYNDDIQYEEFIRMYNENKHTIKEILKILGIGNYRYMKFRKQALSEGRIVQRKNNFVTWRFKE